MNKYYISFSQAQSHVKFGKEINHNTTVEIQAENREDAEKRAKVHFGNGYHRIDNTPLLDQPRELVILSELLTHEVGTIKEVVVKPIAAVEFMTQEDVTHDAEVVNQVPEHKESIKEKIERLKREKK